MLMDLPPLRRLVHRVHLAPELAFEPVQGGPPLLLHHQRQRVAAGPEREATLSVDEPSGPEERDLGVRGDRRVRGVVHRRDRVDRLFQLGAAEGAEAEGGDKLRLFQDAPAREFAEEKAGRVVEGPDDLLLRLVVHRHAVVVGRAVDSFFGEEEEVVEEA